MSVCIDDVLVLQDMRQKFEAEQPDEMNRNEQQADRSQGAARAISVRPMLSRSKSDPVSLNFCAVVH